MSCTCFKMFAGHVSRNFLNISTLVWAFLQSGFGGVGISYPHASGLLLAQLHRHFQTSKCRHLSACQFTKHREKVERSAFSHFLVSQNACSHMD